MILSIFYMNFNKKNTIKSEKLGLSPNTYGESLSFKTFPSNQKSQETCICSCDLFSCANKKYTIAISIMKYWIPFQISSYIFNFKPCTMQFFF